MPPTTTSPGLKNYEILKTQHVRGRGIAISTLAPGKCICDRPHCRILCHVCGYLGWGRLRYSCSKHSQTIFLIDFAQCPNCRAYAFMMSEF